MLNRRGQVSLLEIIVTIILILGVVAAMLHGWWDCTEAGGTYVRGLFWFTCVG